MARYKGIATGRLLHADAAAFCRAADARRGADLLSTRIIRNEAAFHPIQDSRRSADGPTDWRRNAEQRSGHRASGAAVRTSCRLARCRPRRSEEHTSELQSLMRISYAVFG